MSFGAASGAAPDKGSSVNPRHPANISYRLTYEMIHDTRVIPTDGRAHVTSKIRRLNGDSRAHWDGDTLVVDATNFTSRMPYRGSSDALHLIEKFRRIDKDTIRYEVTVDDPQTWTRPFTAALDRRRQAAGMFEYACHEGNYSMLNILKGSPATGELFSMSVSVQCTVLCHRVTFLRPSFPSQSIVTPLRSVHRRPPWRHPAGSRARR